MSQLGTCQSKRPLELEYLTIENRYKPLRHRYRDAELIPKYCAIELKEYLGTLKSEVKPVELVRKPLPTGIYYSSMFHIYEIV